MSVFSCWVITNVIRLYNMKITLLNLLLIIAVICVALGWFMDRRNYPTPEKFDAELEARSDLGFAMGATSASKRTYALYKSATQSEFERKCERELVQNVVFMAIQDINARKPSAISTVGNVPEWRHESMLRMCADSLHLLEIHSTAEFKDRLKASFVVEFTSAFIGPNGELEPEIADDIQQALAQNVELYGAPNGG